MGDGTYFPEAIDVIADVCRETPGAEMILVGSNPRTHGYGGRSFAPIGQMNHHTGPGGWGPLLNFMHHGSSIAPLCNGATSNPYETNGKVIVAVLACGRANHAGVGIWSPSVGTNGGNSGLWGWEHQHAGGSQPWHPLHREVILRLNVGMCLAFNWKAHNTPDHKEYATPPGRKVDRAHEDAAAWRAMMQKRITVGHHSGHAPAPAPAPTPARVVALKRFDGDTWFHTLAMMQKSRFAPGDTKTMYVVRRDTDEAERVAVMGAPWAEVTMDAVPGPTAALIRHFRPTELVVLGGPSAVPGAIAQECQRIAENA